MRPASRPSRPIALGSVASRQEGAVLVVNESRTSISLPLDGELTVGRDPSSDVVLDSPTVSRRHARLGSTVDGWLLTDEGSSNGTYVDGGVLTAGTGTVVGVGTRLRFGDITGEVRPTTPPRIATGAGAKVFLSYSRRDKDDVDRLASDLERSGINVWVDRTGLIGGADWTTEIVKAIHGADAFVVALSRWSVDSDDVANEVHLGGERKLPMFPVLLEPVKVSESLAYHLAGQQQYDLTGDNRRIEIDRLIRAIHSPRVRHHRQLNTTRRLAVAALVIVLLLGIPTAVLSVMTGSAPPDIARITGSRTSDGLDVALTTEDVTRFVSTKTAHLAISLANTSRAAIDLENWSVRLRSGGGSGERRGRSSDGADAASQLVNG